MAKRYDKRSLYLVYSGVTASVILLVTLGVSGAWPATRPTLAAPQAVLFLVAFTTFLAATLRELLNRRRDHDDRCRSDTDV